MTIQLNSNINIKPSMFSMFIPISDLETDIGLNESSFADAYGMSMNETTTAVYESVSFEASTSVVDLLDIAQLSTGQSYVISKYWKFTGY